MKCTKCKHENYDGAAFCEECGEPLRTGEMPHEAREEVGGEAAPIRHSPAPSLNPEVHRAEGRDGQVREVEREEGTEPKSVEKSPPSEKDTEPTQEVEPAPAGEPEETPAQAEAVPCAKMKQEKKLSEGDLREVLVEIQHRECRVGWVNLLHFRLTNLKERGYMAGLSAEISLVRQVERKRQHALPPESLAQEFAMHFRTDEPGPRVVKEIQLRLDGKDERGDQVMIYKVPDDSVQIEVLAPEADTHQSINISGGVKIEVSDLYAVDGVNIHVLDRLSEKKVQEAEQGEHWQPVRLVFDPEATREAQEEIEKKKRGRMPDRRVKQIIDHAPRAKGLQEGKLVISKKTGVWTIFLLAKEFILIGRDPVDDKGNKNDIALRCLDGKASRTISRGHGILYLQDGHTYYKDRSRTGTFRARQRLHHASEKLPEVCTLDFAGVLKLKARTFRAKSKRSLVITRNDSVGPFPTGGMTTDLGMENLGEIDAVRLRRLDGVQHDYVLLARQAIVGSNREDPIFVEGEGVEEIHARILFYKGEFLICSETQESPTLVNGYHLRPEEYCPLAPGKIITLGRTKVLFDAITPEDFKHV